MYIKKTKHPHVHTRRRARAENEKKQVVIIGFISHFGASTEFTIEVICHPPPHTRKCTSRGRKMIYTKTPNSVLVHFYTFKINQQSADNSLVITSTLVMQRADV